MWAGRNRWDQQPEPMGEINVTPLVDVMLVLLIIFMITAPLLTQGVNIDLPNADAPAMQQSVEPLVITVAASGEIYMQKHRVGIDQLASSIADMRRQKPGMPVYVRGDAHARYEAVARVMSILASNGVQKVGLVTEPGRN